MKIIELTQGKRAMVSDIDYPIVNKYVWYYQSRSHREGRASLLGYAARSFKGKTFRMQNQIMQPKKGEIVDHINGNSLDNRRENLRICTIAENNRNAPLRKDSKSGYKGVTKHVTGSWRARVQVNGKNKAIYTKTKEMAAFAYNVMALHYYGEFARLNEIDWISLDPELAMEKLKNTYPDSYKKLINYKGE